MSGAFPAEQVEEWRVARARVPTCLKMSGAFPAEQVEEWRVARARKGVRFVFPRRNAFRILAKQCKLNGKRSSEAIRLQEPVPPQTSTLRRAVQVCLTMPFTALAPTLWRADKTSIHHLFRYARRHRL